MGELFVDVGEERFRDLEDAVVAEALTAPGVLALGSGAVEHAAPALERYRADGGTVVFLDVSLAAGMPRVGLNAPRSVTLGSPRALFSSMAAQRRPVYEAVASTVVDTSDLTVEAGRRGGAGGPAGGGLRAVRPRHMRPPGHRAGEQRRRGMAASMRARPPPHSVRALIRHPQCRCLDQTLSSL